MGERDNWDNCTAVGAEVNSRMKAGVIGRCRKNEPHGQVKRLTSDGPDMTAAELCQ
jgi:hypothetical protein